MKIIEPKVELWQQGDDTKAHVARCARVCYGRETGKPHENAKLIAGMIRNNLMELGYDFRD